VISTGNELVEPGTPVSDWQIYRSNVYGVLTALQRRGHLDLAHDHMADDLESMRARLRSHLATHDVLILSGGVSMGRFDYVPRALGELGVNMVFHKIDQRPGRPMWFGVGANGRMVYALPGNPVSTLICLGRYVFDGLDAAMGAKPRSVERVPLATEIDIKPSLTLFMPVRLNYDVGAGARAEPRPTKGSGDFTSLIGTDGFVELPPGPRVVPAGTVDRSASTRYAGPAAARPAHFGHGSLQLPLPVLHAAGDLSRELSFSQIDRAPVLR
jgi:molybdopterin molybdotransferase